jgi:ABC-type antimicrobial peptide transport system permease subunit
MVTGVMKDLPKNSIFVFEGVLPYSFLKEIGVISDSWGNNSIYTFVRLTEGADILSVNKKLTDIVLEYNPETTTKYLLFSLLDIHLHSQFGFDQSKGPVIVVYIFTLIAIFVLLIACFNFINLSTAKAASRGKEIGIKKVSGANQNSLIVQFMLESLFLVGIALLFSLILVGLSLDLFNSITGKQFIIADLFQGGFIISFIVVGLIAGFISGIYPAFYLSSIKPVAVLKGESISGKGNSRIRQVLVVIQFTMSILIAIVAIFMFMQLKYSQEKELGFDKDNLICIPLSEGMKSKYYSLKNELLKEVLIEGVTAARSNPVRIGSNSGNAWWEGKDPDKEVLIGTNTVDYDYLKTMKMELVAGRDFSREFTGDQVKDTTGNFLVNEEAVKTMGITDPVGKSFRFMGINGRIVGVLKNFHFKSSDQAIEPIAFALTEPAYLSVILIRIAGGNIVESVKVVEKKWNELIPEYPLDYTFIDQDFDSLFKAQLRLTTLLKYFTLLALIIACLGLYGLSSYSAERRTNEVGIRKAMGAGSLMIMYTMSKEFLVLVIISIAIALPLGLIIVKNLLKEFAYRIDMSFAVFAGIAVGAIIISILTISFQAFKSSLINPAEALKVE